MIAALTGRLASKAPTQVTLDVHGVGYDVSIPLSTFYGLPELNQSASLRIHTYLREETIQLYGFLTMEEKGAFVLLTGISGIGPKLALSALSALSVPDLVSAVRTGDLEKIASVPGIGKKSAGRIALELKDKIDRVMPGVVQEPTESAPGSPKVMDDAASALINLGYRAADVKTVLRRIMLSFNGTPALEDLIRESLKDLSRG